MTIIADSGSTKTSWTLTDGRGMSLCAFETQGLNPFHLSESDIFCVLTGEVAPRTEEHGGAEAVERVFFYGSGVSKAKESVMESLLRKVFPKAADVEARSDLVGAARALCGNSPGIAAILGTGANSCLWDGHAVALNTPALGYILGDEGSGAVIGRQFLNLVYKGAAGANLREDFERRASLSLDQIVERVYRQPLANRFLASLTRYIPYYIYMPSVEEMLVDCFRDFFLKNIAPYGRPSLPVSFVGSIAFFFEKQLRRAAETEGFQTGEIVRQPVGRLVEFHARSRNPFET